MAERGVILVVEDDRRLKEWLETNLKLAGYEALTTESGKQGIAHTRTYQPNLVLLDLKLPDISGFEVLETIRRFSNVPILIMTAVYGEDDDVVRGLEMGADDYLIKPFASQVLHARIQTVMRRARPGTFFSNNSVFSAGGLYVDAERREVRVGNKTVYLTNTELKLLAEFIERPNETLTHQQLLTHVWGKEFENAVQILRLTVYRLRQKIEPDPGNPTYILSVSGVGYRLNIPGYRQDGAV